MAGRSVTVPFCLGESWQVHVTCHTIHVSGLSGPPLVLKARAPNDGSAFCIGFSRLEVPEQTLGGIPLGLGMVMKINFFEFSCRRYEF